MDGDLITYFAAALVGAFVVLSWALLSKYRNLTAKVAESTELARGLWNELDSRLKKQDERILDVLTRFEVYESRRKPQPPAPLAAESPPSPSSPPPSEAEAERLPKREEEKMKQVTTTKAALEARTELLATERVVLQLLLERPRTSVEIKSLIKKSREHSARLMKELFERRLVSRDDRKKPFVYELTEEGRRYLSAT